MTAPYLPTVFATAPVNSAIASVGAPPVPYLSPSMYQFAPTAMDTKTLKPGGDAQSQSQDLADTIQRASRWADAMCFGSDPSSQGASLAASLAVETAMVGLKQGSLRLVCNRKPILQVVGVDLGLSPAQTASVGPTIAAAITFGIRTIYVPLSGIANRPGGIGFAGPALWTPGGSIFAVWSYVSGYPHTKVVGAIAQNATSVVVQATDGNGGVWGTIPGMSYFTCFDGKVTETVLVTAVTPNTPSAGKTTFTTTPFANAHTLPTAPDFLPFSAIPEDIHQAAISLTSMLIKARGNHAFSMPTVPGGRPTGVAKGQAGVTRDYDIAAHLLRPYRIRTKSKV